MWLLTDLEPFMFPKILNTDLTGENESEGVLCNMTFWFHNENAALIMRPPSSKMWGFDSFLLWF